MIKVLINDLVLEAELFDTDCARSIYNTLPLESHIHEWGDEFYFPIPLAMELDETATTSVKAGDIGYWPPGRAIAIFFGPTPLSTGDDPVPASDVNIVGRLLSDPKALKNAKGASKIRIVPA
ncbi:MAG: cyclophilin-like fold protein [Thermodesulfovibrionales bacterium]|nr:cyclophilin-like fold protein [Thermodesulfovibrionales bacterium]